MPRLATVVVLTTVCAVSGKALNTPIATAKRVMVFMSLFFVFFFLLLLWCKGDRLSFLRWMPFLDFTGFPRGVTAWCH